MPSPPLHRRQSFHHNLHVGAENELKGTVIVLLAQQGGSQVTYAPVEIGYGMSIGVSAGTSDVGNLRLIDLQVEGASGGRGAHTGAKGMIEHVGGPMRTSDDLKDRAARALSEFIATAMGGAWKTDASKVTVSEVERGASKQVDYHPVAKLFDAYNARLRQLGPAYDPFHLAEKVYHANGRSCRWYIRVVGNVEPHTQLNFEVPFSRIGVRGDGGIAPLFTDKRAMFAACLQAAHGMVDVQFAAAAAARKHRDLTYLHSLFTLYFFVAAVKAYLTVRRAMANGLGNISDHERKNQFEILPKVSLNDVVRFTLSDADRALLLAVLGDEHRRKFFVTCARSYLKDIMRSHYSVAYGRMEQDMATYDQELDAMCTAVFVPGAGARYTKETAKRYGKELSDRCGAPFTDAGQPASCKRPAGHAGAHSTELAMAEQRFTGTGKPLGAAFYDVGDDKGRKIGKAATIVFEMRAIQNELNKIGNPQLLTLDLSAAANPLRRLAQVQNLTVPPAIPPRPATAPPPRPPRPART